MPKTKKKTAQKTARPARRPSHLTSKRPARGISSRPSRITGRAQQAAAPSRPATTVNVYLNFNGNCEEAFNLYRSVFSGNFGMVQKFKDAPAMEGEAPSPADAEKILHVSLPVSKETVLMGCDVPEKMGPVTVGTNFSISVNAPDKKEADRMYAQLSSEGKQTMPMGPTFWSSWFGMLTDKFGIQWMISAGGSK